MSNQALNIRTPVRREGAQNYLLLSLISFGGSVVATRLFLELTGYPQIGGGELHIAHVLWGGLLLFVAALVPLIYANRWAYTTGALLSGVGVGLFIDEVGKFITQNNDYFYPPAAPIIYALFLLTVLIYLRVRRPPAWDPRHELYAILDNITEVLDHDLETEELTEMQARLNQVAAFAGDKDLANLAQALSIYLAEKARVVPTRLSRYEQLRGLLTAIENRLFNRARVRLTLILALTAVSVLTFFDIFNRLLPQGQPLTLENILTMNVIRGDVRSLAGANWFFVHLALQVIVCVLALLAAALVITGKEKRGLEIGMVAMVLSLTMVNLLSFFVDQFAAVLIALLHLAVVLLISYYRKRYFRVNLSL